MYFIFKNHEFSEGVANLSVLVTQNISIISDEFALNYVKTLVIPGALEKFRAEEDRDKHNGKNAFLINLPYSF